MKSFVFAVAAFANDITEASNATGRSCYETAPSNKHYQLTWKAEGKTFFDDLKFAEGPAATNGAVNYLSKERAFREGVISAGKTRAKMRIGKAYHTSSGPRRHSVHVATKHRYKHMLAVMRYKHVPFGLGVWPAFWMNGRTPWPEHGEMDILEYASHDGQKVSVHTGHSNRCKLSPQIVQKCGEMMDSNGMGFDCYTNYGKGQLGCAPTTFAGQRPPEYWSANPGALAVEWTDRFIKVFYFEEAEIPDDLDTETPRPDTWDEKWVIAYFPFAASNEAHPGWCPHPADVLDEQEIILNIELCGDWAGGKWSPHKGDPYSSEWKGKRDRGECRVSKYHHAGDCCTNYIGQKKLDDYMSKNAYFDINYLKIFQLKNGPPPKPVPTARRRRSAPAPSYGKCSNKWEKDTDCSGADLKNRHVKTPEECCELCSKTPGCTAFTHNVFDGHLEPTCYLKKSCEKDAKMGKRGCVSGVPKEIAPYVPPAPTPPGMCGNYLENTDCSGGDIKDKAMENADDCCAWCQETAGCHAFTHNLIDGHGKPWCYLKKSCKESKRGWNGGCTSGADIKSVPTPPPPPPPPPSPGCGSDNYMKHTDCAGADIKNKALDSAEECCAWCAETPGCTAFTHNTVDGHGKPYCYLKKSCPKSKRGSSRHCTSADGIPSPPAPPSPPPSAARRRRRRASGGGCCSWASSNECGATTEYCKANADNCEVCGGHWVPHVLADELSDEEVFDRLMDVYENSSMLII